MDGEDIYDNSGFSVALSADGNIVAIGAPINGGYRGHVRVYAWSGSAWVQRGADIDGEAANDWSGFSLSMSADGDRVAIGAFGSDGAGTNARHVRVYSWQAVASSQPEVVLPPDLAPLVTTPVNPTTTPAPSTTTTTTTTAPTTTAPSGATPMPVSIDGSLPELAAGDVTVVEDGEPVTVEVFVENDTELVVQSSRFELRLEGDCTEAACTIDTSPEGREVLTLQENGKANTEGEGFLPGSTVHVWLFSEPRYLGALTVLPDGTFEGDVNLGDIAVGEHTLQVNGISQTGAERSANLGVIVNPNQAPTPEPGELPATGSNSTPIWLVAMTLLGLGLVDTTRRRNA